MNYLQYIKSVDKDELHSRFIVSGVDTRVRNVVGNDIMKSCYNRNKTLFVIDNTTRSDNISYGNIEGYGSVVNLLDGKICLCRDFFKIESLTEMSRFRMLLSDMGFQYTEVNRIVAYINWVKELERQFGNENPLTFERLEEYGSPILADLKLRKLLDEGRVSEYDYQYLLGRFSEVSAAAADFETFFSMIQPFSYGDCVSSKPMVIYFPIKGIDYSMIKIVSALLTSAMIEHVDSSALIIVADNVDNEKDIILSILHRLPVHMEIHLMTDNVFAFDNEAQEGTVLSFFDIKIFTRHSNMFDCKKIQEYCGEFESSKKTYTTTVDKRLKNSAWDILFRTNRTETEIQNLPLKEYYFRKERIHSLPEGCGILEVNGKKLLMPFLNM